MTMEKELRAKNANIFHCKKAILDFGFYFTIVLFSTKVIVLLISCVERAQMELQNFEFELMWLN